MSIMDDIANFASDAGSDAESFFNALKPIVGNANFLTALASAIPLIGEGSELASGPYKEALSEGQGLLDDYQSGTLNPGDQAALDAFKASADAQANQQSASMGLSDSTQNTSALDTANADAAQLQGQMVDSYLSQGLGALNSAQKFANAGNGLSNQEFLAKQIGNLVGAGLGATQPVQVSGPALGDLGLASDAAGLGSQVAGLFGGGGLNLNDASGTEEAFSPADIFSSGSSGLSDFGGLSSAASGFGSGLDSFDNSGLDFGSGF